MKEEEKKETIERYNERLKKYGYDPKTLGWLKGKQDIRFYILTEIGIRNNDSILDVGCGFGDLFGFFNKKKMDIKYTGVDINPNLIDIGKKVYPSANFSVMDFEQEDIDKKFDWVLASGIFNFKLENNEKFIKNMLKKMFDISKKGVAVDFMSSYVDFQNEGAYHTKPEEVFSYSKTLSKRVALRNDYFPFEFCLYLYKNDSFNEKTVFIEYSE
jgi:ubiquinone/menaquinone biosynthesis C-methylase UbiE